jgi:hypothetical protein
MLAVFVAMTAIASCAHATTAPTPFVPSVGDGWLGLSDGSVRGVTIEMPRYRIDAWRWTSEAAFRLTTSSFDAPTPRTCVGGEGWTRVVRALSSQTVIGTSRDTARWPLAAERGAVTLVLFAGREERIEWQVLAPPGITDRFIELQPMSHPDETFTRVEVGLREDIGVLLAGGCDTLADVVAASR